MKRSELRETIFKLLFMAQFNSTEEMPEQVRLYFESLESGREEFPCSKAPTEADEAYMQEKYSRVAQRLPEIDGLLNATATGWKTSRMGKVDLTILRLAVYEMPLRRRRARERGHQRGGGDCQTVRRRRVGVLYQRNPWEESPGRRRKKNGTD